MPDPVPDPASDPVPPPAGDLPPASAEAPAPADGGSPRAPRRPRADARRNFDALLKAARWVFDNSGVDAPAKEIADLAGVGVGTLYRHFPQRSDLVKAVVRSGIDACAEAGPRLSAQFPPWDALAQWLRQFTDFLGAKRGLASALHSGDPAYEALPGYFHERLDPVLSALLDAGVAAGTVRADVSAQDLLRSVAHLSNPVPGQDRDFPQRMVAVLIDGLRVRPE